MTNLRVIDKNKNYIAPGLSINAKVVYTAEDVLEKFDFFIIKTP